jgi:outer membrane protein OmpA-like peptidoglycan-associated protein
LDGTTGEKYVDDKTLKRLAALTGLGLVGVVGVGAVVGSNSAADDLQPKAYKALSAHHLRGLNVDFDGREAKISGGTAADMAKAKKVVEDIHGVRWAKVTGKPTSGSTAATPAVASMKFSHSDLGSTIMGVVPSAEVAASLKAAAAEAFGGTVSGDFKIDPTVDSADWFNELPEVFGDLVGVDDLDIGIGGLGSIQVTGTVGSQIGADKVKDLLTAALPDLTVDSTLTVDAGALSPADAQTLDSATLYFGRGKSTLTSGNKAALDKVADVMKRNADLKIEAGGHAGPSDPARGKVLSDERVAAVKAYLVDAGVDAKRVSTKSFGSGEKSGGDPFAKKYRRVDFAVEGN